MTINSRYFPTIPLRPSEMTGVEKLQDLIKGLITPIFLMAPWANSNDLINSINKIFEVFPNRKFILDIDRDFQTDNRNRQAYIDFESLKDPNKHFKNWRHFWKGYPNIIPCLQINGPINFKIDEQIDYFRRKRRLFCVRLEFNRNYDLNSVIEHLSDLTPEEFIIVLEGGWVENPLNLCNTIKNFLSMNFGKIDGDVPIVVSCTSFPYTFDNIFGMSEIPFSNLELLNQLRQEFNFNLVYGDWGSSRPRTAQNDNHPYGKNETTARIDYPLDSSWLISKKTSTKLDFQSVAKNIISDKRWNGNLNTW